MFKFVQTRFKKLLDYFELFDDISASTGINETAALYCIVTAYTLLFLASLQ